MSIDIQILSFVFSFLYGIIVYIAFKYIKKYIYFVKNVYKFLNSLLFFTDVSIVYFLVLYFINNGHIHIYFILSSFSSFLIMNVFYKKNVN